MLKTAESIVIVIPPTATARIKISAGCKAATNRDN
jgi:hypothetical protein